MSFLVIFDPPLPDGPSVVVPSDLEWADVYNRALGLEPLALSYLVCGMSFGYDYADPYVVLSDLVGELASLDLGSPHSVLMSGYPVVDVTVRDNLVTFYQIGDPDHWSAEIEIAEVREALSSASNMLWGLILSRSTEPENKV